MTMRGGGLWPTRTNLFRQGQCAAITDWGQSSGGVVTRAVDAATKAPFAARSIKVTTDGGAANQGVAAQSASGQAASAGTTGAGSLYFLGVAGQSYRVQMWWVNGDATNTFGTATTFTASGFWQQLNPALLSVLAGKTGNRLLINLTINGTRAESFWVAHAQIEIGVGQVSPYIPTTGGNTASRPGGRRWQLENSRRMMHRYAQVWP